MNKSLVVVPLTALCLSACVVSPRGRVYGPAVDVAVDVPTLPLVVELGPEPYYFHGGYTYFYDRDRWRYGRSRSGPWLELPRSHYPRETHFRGRMDRRDSDGDGVPDRRDSAPYNPRRY